MKSFVNVPSKRRDVCALSETVFRRKKRSSSLLGNVCVCVYLNLNGVSVCVWGSGF